MLRALVHLHELEVAHADIRLDNFLCHPEGTIVICDFTCSRRFGQETHRRPGAREPRVLTAFQKRYQTLQIGSHWPRLC